MAFNCNYICITREFINSKQSIYKLGKSSNFEQRKKSYPKGTQFKYVMESPHMSLVENHAITLFKTLFKHRPDIGREYFEGDFNSMKRFMDCLIEHYRISVSIDNLVEMERDIIKENAVSVIQKYYREFRIKKIKASMIIQKYWKKYQLEKNNKNIENFVGNNILVRKDKFLKLKDIKKLWNTENNNRKLNDYEISNLFQNHLGKMNMSEGSLGWQNKDFKTAKEIMADKNKENDMIYKIIKQNFLITDNDDDNVSFESIYDFVINKGIQLSKKKIGLKLNDLGFKSDDIKINNKTAKVRLGLKYKTDLLNIKKI